MSRRWLAWCAAIGLPIMVACTGGGGAIDEGSLDRQDKAPTSQDPVASTTETAPTSQDPVAKTNEPALSSTDTSTASSTFSCHGTYDCTGTNGDAGSTIVLDGGPGACTSKGTTIAPDGTISQDGVVYAHWTGGDAAFTFTTTDTNTDSFPDGGTTTTTTTDTVTCSKVSDSTTPISEDGGS